ncbi:MAG: HAD hydrolase family protein [Nitrososphaerota archaeon]|nr:HAD hydrolase family protein [Nitrososphaerota archaeon]
MKECAHVGDSQNDVETFRRVGYSIALNCSDSRVRKEASVSFRLMIS